jgi:heterodisulfide reductase subunit C
MSEEYASQADAEELQALECYWVKNFGLVSPGLKAPLDKAVLEKGKIAHQINCAQCHSGVRRSFGGYAASILIRPVASALDAAGAVAFLSWVHFVSALVVLAYMPFSKMYHIVATRLSLMVNSVMDRQSDPVNIATRQMLELDACTHCGACTLRCSVALAVHEIPNQNILPSEKMASLKRLAAGRVLDPKELWAIQQGIVLCTNCDRCSIACPSGIQLRDLWFSAREGLLQQSVAEYQLLSPLAYYRGLKREAVGREDYLKPLELALSKVAGPNGTPKNAILRVGDKMLPGKLNASIQANSLFNCYRCVTCTNSCPVVNNFKNPAQVLGILPHQLMHAIGLRCWEMVFSSRML